MHVDEQYSIAIYEKRQLKVFNEEFFQILFEIKLSCKLVYTLDKPCNRIAELL